MIFKIGIIGAGAVAYGMTDAISLSGLSIKTVVSRKKNHAQRLARRIGTKKFGTDYRLLSDCNFIIIAASDASLTEIAKKTAIIAFKSNAVTIVHTSGSLSSDVLQSAKANIHTSVSIASMHPMQTFLSRSTSKKKLPVNTCFGIEGEKKALKITRQFLRRIDARAVLVSKENKSLYHIGGIMASNFVVALFYEILNLYKKLGWSEKQMLAVVTPLLNETIANMQDQGIVPSLTGPASRKDMSMIQYHYKILSKESVEIAKLYQYLTDICLKITLNKL